MTSIRIFPHHRARDVIGDASAPRPAHHVLIVEDDADMAYVIERNLKREGCTVEVASDGDAAIAAGIEDRADLIVLDLMLPRQNGFTVLRTLRGAGVDAPVLLLTARNQDADKVQGFRLGADDYVTKPFSMPELMARVAALMRRSEMPPRRAGVGAAMLRGGPVSIDLVTRAVRREGKAVALSPKAYDLLVALMRRANSVVRRADLMREIWGYADGVASRTLDTHVNELRKKLEDDPSEPRLLKTVWRVGYVFACGEDS
jgi:DNA-binding response OmpR family regulator